MWRNRESLEVREKKQSEKEERQKRKQEKVDKKRNRREERKMRKYVDLDKILENNPLLRQKKIICFDLYGTLIHRPNSLKYLKKILKIVWAEPLKDYRKIAQTKPKEQIEKEYKSKHGSNKIIEMLIEAFQNHTEDEALKTEVFWDTIEVLKKLQKKGYKIALISNLSQDFEKPLRDLITPEFQFDYEARSYDVWFMKPNPEIFQKILDDANKDVDEDSKYEMKDLLMIWDSITDDVDWARWVWMDAILIKRRKDNSEKTGQISYNEEKNLITVRTLKALYKILGDK